MPLLTRHLRLPALIATFAAVGPATAFDETDFNADGRKHQPVPTGHVRGKDQGAGAGLHNTGEDCGTCHTPFRQPPPR